MLNRGSGFISALLTLSALALATSACNSGGSSKASGAGSTTAATKSSTTSSVKSGSTTTGTVKSSSTTTATTGSSSTAGVHTGSSTVLGGPGKIGPVTSGSSSTSPVTTTASTSASVALGPNASAFLYVASSNDKITTLQLDLTTGAPSNPVDTDLGTGGTFMPAGIAADASGSTLFVTGSTSLLAIGLNAGALTVPAASSTTNPVLTSYPGAMGVLVLPGTSFALTADGNAYSGAGGLDAFAWQTASNGIVVEAAGNELIGTYGGPASFATDASGAWVYFANPYDGNVQTASVSTSATTVTFGTASAPAADPSWNTNYTGPSACALVTQSGSTTFFTGNNDGSISAFPVTAPGAFGTPSTAYTPAASGNGSIVSGIAADSTGQFLVISDQAANQLFAFTVTITAGVPTLAPAGPGAGPISSAMSVCFNADGPVCYAVDNQYYAGNNAASSVSAYSVSATGLTLVGTGVVALPDVNDSPVALAVSR